MQVSTLVTFRELVINLSGAMERLMNIAYIVNNEAERERLLVLDVRERFSDLFYVLRVLHILATEEVCEVSER